METAVGIILIVILALILLWPLLNRWLGPLLQRWIAGKMEDRFRRMMGMPTRKEERKAAKQWKKQQQKDGAQASAYGGTAYGPASRGRSRRPIIPKEYAEDVEFVEIKEYSSDVEIGIKEDGTTFIKEEQVEDAEYIEIKK